MDVPPHNVRYPGQSCFILLFVINDISCIDILGEYDKFYQHPLVYFYLKKIH